MTLQRNLLIGWTSHATTLIVGLFLVRFVRDALGDDGYGAWIFVNSIAGYAGLLYFGFGAAVTRQTSRCHALQDWETLNRGLSSVFAVYLVSGGLALLASAVVAAVAPWLSDWSGQSLAEVRAAILLLGLNAAVGLWGSVYGGVLYGLQRFDLYRGIQIGCTLLRVALFVAALSWSPSILAMACAYLGVTLVENAAHVVVARRLIPTLRISLRAANRSNFRESFAFASFNAVTLLSDQIIGLTDTIVIGCVLGTAATVPYYIAQRLCQMARVPLEQIAEMLLPKSTELQTRQQFERLRLLATRAAGFALLLIGGATLGAAYFGDRLLRVWLGDGNDASLPILMVLLAAQLVALPVRVFKSTLVGLGEVRTPALFDLSQAFANLVLSLILIRAWGIIGVAWGTLLPAVIFELGVMLPYACRKLNLGLRQLLRDGVLPQLPPLAALWAFCAAAARLPLADSWWSLLLIAGLGGAVLIGVRGGMHWLSTRGPKRSSPVAGEALTP